jgi:hypothetical protein
LASTSHGLDRRPGTLHGPHRRPAVEVIADDPPVLPPRWDSHPLAWSSFQDAPSTRPYRAPLRPLPAGRAVTDQQSGRIAWPGEPAASG